MGGSRWPSLTRHRQLPADRSHRAPARQRPEPGAEQAARPRTPRPSRSTSRQICMNDSSSGFPSCEALIDRATRAAKPDVLAEPLGRNALAARAEQVARATTGPAPAADRLLVPPTSAVLHPLRDAAAQIAYAFPGYVLW